MLAGIAKVKQDTPCDLLIWQTRSPVTRLGVNEILFQNKTGNGMTYVMAILDDVVTRIMPVDAPVPDESNSSTETH